MSKFWAERLLSVLVGLPDDVWNGQAKLSAYGSSMVSECDVGYAVPIGWKVTASLTTGSKPGFWAFCESSWYIWLLAKYAERSLYGCAVVDCQERSPRYVGAPEEFPLIQPKSGLFVAGISVPEELGGKLGSTDVG